MEIVKAEPGQRYNTVAVDTRTGTLHARYTDPRDGEPAEVYHGFVAWLRLVDQGDLNFREANQAMQECEPAAERLYRACQRQRDTVWAAERREAQHDAARAYSDLVAYKTRYPIDHDVRALR